MRTLPVQYPAGFFVYRLNFLDPRISNKQFKIRHMKSMFIASCKKMAAKLNKKHFVMMVIAAILVMAASTSASAQIYVSIRPTPPVIVRTAAPSPAHVWIGEEWEVRNGVYVHTGGRWALPPHPGWIWIPGHWSHDGRGHIWRPGHWRRR